MEERDWQSSQEERMGCSRLTLQHSELEAPWRKGEGQNGALGLGHLEEEAEERHLVPPELLEGVRLLPPEVADRSLNPPRRGRTGPFR